MKLNLNVKKIKTENLSCYNYVYLSRDNLEKLSGDDLDPSNYILEITSENNVKIWHKSYHILDGIDIKDNNIYIPSHLLDNLLIKENDNVSIDIFDYSDCLQIKKIRIIQKNPDKKERPLSMKRDNILYKLSTINYPIKENFTVMIPVRMKNGEDIFGKFLVDEIVPYTDDENVEDSLPFVFPEEVRLSKDVEIFADLGNLKKKNIIGFKKIGGLDKEIRKIKEVIELPYKYSKIFNKIGVKPSKGILLKGPPGTGKTLIAKAISEEINANFIKINASELFSQYAGQAEKKLRELFQEANESKRAIVFIDEIDALAVKRSEAQEDFSRRLVGQFLPLMDGVEQDGRVVVIGATNRPSAIDPAFRRPGRFDKEITIGIPDKSSRKDIFRVHTKNMNLSSDVDLDFISDKTFGCVGADIEAICREAGVNAINRLIKKEKKGEKDFAFQVGQEDFNKVIESIVPSTLRELRQDIPMVDWHKDIIGYNKTKKILLNNIKLSLDYSDSFQKMGINTSYETLLIGPKLSGKKTLVYGLVNKLKININEVNLSKWVFKENLEDYFFKLIEVAKASKPTVVLFPSIDELLNVIKEDTILKQRVNKVFIDYFDKISSTDKIFTIFTAENKNEVYDSFYKNSRIDKIIELEKFTEKDSKNLIDTVVPNNIKNSKKIKNELYKKYKHLLVPGEILNKMKFDLYDCLINS